MGIVKFKSKASADIVMFKEHAERLLTTMGLQLGDRGLIQPAHLAQAHALLVAAVNTEKMAKADWPPVEESELSPEELHAHRNQVSLEQRAYPLLKMLEAATKQGVDVHWGF